MVKDFNTRHGHTCAFDLRKAGLPGWRNIPRLHNGERNTSKDVKAGNLTRWLPRLPFFAQPSEYGSDAVQVLT